MYGDAAEHLQAPGEESKMSVFAIDSPLLKWKRSGKGCVCSKYRKLVLMKREGLFGTAFVCLVFGGNWGVLWSN